MSSISKNKESELIGHKLDIVYDSDFKIILKHKSIIDQLEECKDRHLRSKLICKLDRIEEDFLDTILFKKPGSYLKDWYGSLKMSD